MSEEESDPNLALKSGKPSSSGTKASGSRPPAQKSSISGPTGSSSTAAKVKSTDANGSEADSSDEEGMVKAMRKMGIRAPRPFDPKKDKNFENWLDRTEFHFQVSKCPDDDRTGSLLLLLDVECFEVAKHLGINSRTDFDTAKQKLKDYYAVTETTDELREKLYLRTQEVGESIETFARDIKLLGHRAYPNGDPELLEHILVKQFTSGLRDEKSRERVILKSPASLTEAAQYARFSEAAVRVAHGRPVTQSSTVSSLNYRGRGSNFDRNKSRGRGDERSYPQNKFVDFRGQQRGRSRGRGAAVNSGSRTYPDNPRFAQTGREGQRPIKCYNCQKLGHIARDCRSPPSTGFGGMRNNTSNWRDRPTRSWRNRQPSNYRNRVATVGQNGRAGHHRGAG